MTKTNYNDLERKVGHMISQLSGNERIEVIIIAGEYSDFLARCSASGRPTSGGELQKISDKSTEKLAKLCEERDILYKKEIGGYIRANVHGEDLVALLQNKTVSNISDIRLYNREE